MKTLENFLEKHNIITSYGFAKNMTLPEFLKKSDPVYILHLFGLMHPEKLRETWREQMLVMMHCVNTVKNSMDSFSGLALEHAICFLEGNLHHTELLMISHGSTKSEKDFRRRFIPVSDIMSSLDLYGNIIPCEIRQSTYYAALATRYALEALKDCIDNFQVFNYHFDLKSSIVFKAINDAVYNASAIAFTSSPAALADESFSACVAKGRSIHNCAGKNPDTWIKFLIFAREEETKNKKLTADICRKYLPLEIWDLTKL